MIEYVLGFVYDEETKGLLLISNNKTQRWNGIGGKVEGNESPTSAMCREANEEAGLDLEWKYIGRMLCSNYILHIFRSTTKLDPFFYHETEEGAVMFHYTLPTFALATDVRWLAEMCQSPTKGRFEFQLQ